MKACLLLGSNMGDREALLAQAQSLICRDCGHVIKASKIYETEPWGFDADTPFLNQALLIGTAQTPQELLIQCLRIENLLGRERPANIVGAYTSRSIDIDLLFYEEVVCQTPRLTLPHPQLHLRKFALEPLSEVDPMWKHPVLGFTAQEMIKNL